MELAEPHRTRVVEVNRTTLRVWEWGTPGDPPVICAHGAHDHGRMWDEVAPAVAAHGYHVVAPDLRGHGGSGRISSGHLWEACSLDLALLAREVGDPVGLLGHSFGGGLSLYVAAVWPELVRWVVDIDGLGPPADAFEEDDDLVGAATTALDALEKLRARPPRVYASLEEMASRRGQVNVRLPPEWLLHLARHGAHPVEGGWTWATDPVFNIGFPGDFGPEVLLAQYALVDRPVLVLTGTEEDAWTGLPEDELAERVAALGAEHQAVPGAGHYVHIEQPGVVIDAVLRFATEVDGLETGAT
ncbi:alpha/beta fold hydrolase [Actinomarinicola tropica]|uniref:Alpha/beta fold hydrolase n=1 Tax=Actinomarinicola tropica TaxID=2789776 RepID=A0A5Q2RIV6_9ACTN|nr:alpha/beta hydrolase [Actinomarinicola tropica]QGG96709.1 alpha/beta fold hydrolase [Actinomarinicola tropica]